MILVGKGTVITRDETKPLIKDGGVVLDGERIVKVGDYETLRSEYPQAELIHSDVLSFDSCVSMREAREHLKKHALMGNVSTWTLEFGQPEKVEQLAVKCWKDGSNIISPACGLGTKSPLTNIQAIRHGIMEEAANV
mgnify:CR=1 FL=1